MLPAQTVPAKQGPLPGQVAVCRHRTVTPNPVLVNPESFMEASQSAGAYTHDCHTGRLWWLLLYAECRGKTELLFLHASPYLVQLCPFIRLCVMRFLTSQALLLPCEPGHRVGKYWPMISNILNNFYHLDIFGCFWAHYLGHFCPWNSLHSEIFSFFLSLPRNFPDDTKNDLLSG